MPKSTPDRPDDNSNVDISALRLAIDEIDEKIMDLINRRLLMAQQIGGIKKRRGIQITDRQRENEIIDRLRQNNDGPLGEDGLRRIFETIMAAGRNVQKPDRKPK